MSGSLTRAHDRAAHASCSSAGSPGACAVRPQPTGPTRSAVAPPVSPSLSSAVPQAPRFFRGRIGAEQGHGFYAAPHRYEVYLTGHCPDAARVSVTLGLLGLRESVQVRFLGPADPSGTASPAEAELRGRYEATWHHYTGPLAVPALCDRWSGRVVSNHTPDILRDLTARLVDPDSPYAPRLRPPALVGEIDRLEGLWARAGRAGDAERAGTPARRALDLVAGRLRSAPYVLGKTLTAADVDAWAVLRPLTTGREAGGQLAAHPAHARLTSYVARLDALPAFRATLDTDLALT